MLAGSYGTIRSILANCGYPNSRPGEKRKLSSSTNSLRGCPGRATQIYPPADPAGGKTATVGLTAFALEMLTDLVHVELPEVGRAVKAGQPFGEIESVKAVSDLYSPVDGEVVAVNAALADNLEHLADDPYRPAGSSRSRSATKPAWPTCSTKRRTRNSAKKSSTRRRRMTDEG